MLNDKTLNSYNNFATQYSNSSSNKLVHNLIEKPAMYALLTDLKDKVVLDLGCGTGDECMKMCTLGAKKVIGIDASFGMIQEAKKKYQHDDRMEFLVEDFSNLEKLSIENASIDFVYSSLALHYESDLTPIFSKLNNLLKPSGKILFSLNHPLVSSWELISHKGVVFDGLGKVKLENGEEKYLGKYFDNSLREETWFEGKFNYNYYHHTFESTVNSLVQANFKILKVSEPKPISKAETAGKDANKFNDKFFKIPKAIIYLVEKI